MQILLEASTKRENDELMGFGIDPFEESAAAAEKLVYGLGGNHHITILWAAIGDTIGDAELLCLAPDARNRVRKEMKAMGKTTEEIRNVDDNIAYLENMSCTSIGNAQEAFISYIREAERLSATSITLLDKRTVPALTFDYIFTAHNIKGCEVLVIDAEGADCAILKSMIDICTHNGIMWPWVVQFEAQGHAGQGNEEAMLCTLQSHGYLLLSADWNLTLVHGPTLSNHSRLCKWADLHFTLQCSLCKRCARPSSNTFAKDVGKGRSQWRWDEWSCKWCCDHRWK